MHDVFPWTTPTEAFDWELSPLDTTVAELRDMPGGLAHWYKSEELFRTHGRLGFPTESKKVDLYATRLERFSYAPLPIAKPLDPEICPSDDYPLICGTGLKLGLHTHTQFHTLPGIRDIEPERFVEIHPRQARRLGVKDHDLVRLTSPWGSVTASARVRDGTSEDVVMLCYGYGQAYAGSKRCSSNDMTWYSPCDPISGATNNRRVPCRISVEKEKGESDRQTALLLLDQDHCVGCHTCELACEQLYGETRISVHELGPDSTVRGETHLDFTVLTDGRCRVCGQRLADGGEPACVAACPTRALRVTRTTDVVRDDTSRKLQICAIAEVPVAPAPKEGKDD